MAEIYLSNLVSYFLETKFRGKFSGPSDDRYFLGLVAFERCV